MVQVEDKDKIINKKLAILKDTGFIKSITSLHEETKSIALGLNISEEESWKLALMFHVNDTHGLISEIRKELTPMNTTLTEIRQVLDKIEKSLNKSEK